jgi:hypothetical protein
MSIDQFGMWWGGLLHCRTGKAFASPAVPQLRDRATGRHLTVAGFPRHTEIDGVAALLVTIRMCACSSRRQREFPLLCILPTVRHRPCELRWGCPSLCPCQGRGRARNAPLGKNRPFCCDPRPDTGERYHLENTPKHLSIKMFFLLGMRAMAAAEADQVPQRRRREQDYRPVCRRTKVQHRQIGPVPRNAGDPADAKAH